MEDQLTGSLADEEAAMHRGRAGSLIVMGAFGVALLVGLALLIGGDDEARVYGEIGKKVNGLDEANFDQFWACALQGENVNDIKSNSELSTHIDVRGRERGRSYGLHVRDKCLPKLEDIGPQLDTLIAPEDLQADIKALRDANNDLRSAWSGLVSYLDDPELEYDSEASKSHIAAIAKHWYAFKKAHGQVNKTIKSKVK